MAANVTITQATSAGYALTWPAGSPQPLASNANFLWDRNVAAATLVTLGRTPGQASIFASGSTDVVVDVSGYFLGTPLADQTLATPRRCDTMMAFLRRNPATGSRSVVIGDLAAVKPELTVKTDVDIDAVRVAPNCDYLVLLSASPGVEDRYDISIAYDFIRDAATGVKRVSLAQGLPFLGMEVTDDSRYVIFYYSTGFNGAGKAVTDYLAAADVTTLRLRRGGLTYTAGYLSWVSETVGDDNLVNVWMGPTPQLLECYRFIPQCHGPNVISYRSARTRDRTSRSFIDAHERSDSTYLSTPGSSTAFTPGMFRPRFTYNGELTLSNSGAELRGIWLYDGLWYGATAPALRGRKILDNVNDAGQAFSRRWRPDVLTLPQEESMPAPPPVLAAGTAAAPLTAQSTEGATRCTLPIDALSMAERRTCG